MILDQTDVKILELLQGNARATASEIGAKVGMSVSAVSERIRKMEQNNIIEGYTAILNHKTLRKDVTAFISVCLDYPKYNENFVQFVRKTSDILECHYLAGEFDYLLKVVTDSTSTLEKLLRRVKCTEGVLRTYTSLVLTTEKNDYSIAPSGISDVLRERGK